MGGTGNDVLEGGTGRDQYYFEAGFGRDIIRDTSGPDSIRMLGDFTASDVTTRQSGDSVIIGFAGVTDTITLDGFFGPSGSSVTRVIFEDGSEFTLDAIRQQADETDGPDTVTYTHANVDVRTFDGDDVITLTGRGTNTVDAGPGNDTVTGGSGSDTLIGGTGNDILNGNSGNDLLDGGAGDDELTVTGGTARGGSGNDTYIWKRTGIIDEQGAGGVDVIEAQVTGNPDNFVYTRVGDDLTIKSSFFSILTIRNHFSADGASRVETLRLTDGREIDLSTPPSLVLGGSERSDTLQASGTSPDLEGNGGDDTLNGSSGANVLIGGDGDDTLSGGAGNDDLQSGNGFDDIDGGSGNDLLNGGTGNDSLNGGAGSDTYTWAPGDGNDTITDSGGNDVLRIAINASQEQLIYDRDGNDLLIGGLPTSRFSSSGSATITIENHFAPGNANRVEQIEFANGNTVNLATINTSSGSTTGTPSSDFLRGTDANETLDGGDGNDRLDGGGGNDTLRGGNGSDTYVWGPGYGNDRIEETDEGRSSFDRVVLSSSLTRDDVSVEQSGLDMVLRLSTGETLTIVGQFDETKSIGVGTIGGSRTGSLQFSPLDVRGGDGDDTLRAGTRRTTVDGQDGNDTLFGGSGSDRDTLRGGDGNDILDGNAGDDFLIGGPGNDVYRGETLWEDTISDQGGGQDRIELPEGITPDDVTFQRTSFSGLIIDISGKGKIGIAGQFSEDDANKIETLRFADGTELSLENPTFSLRPTQNIGSLDGSERDETLIGSSGRNTLKGFGGNDRLEGLGGPDDLIGGDGDDVLMGGSGNDTYDPGLGHDTIDEQGGGGTDILKLQEGIRPTDLTLTRNGNDLSIFVSDQQSIMIVDHFAAGGQSAIEQLQFTDRDGARRIDMDDIPLSTSSASQSAAVQETGYSATQSAEVVAFAPIVDEAGLS